MKATRRFVMTIVVLFYGFLCTALCADAGENIVLSDVKSGAYYAEAVNWALTNKLINGFPDGTFRADDPLTYAQISTILWRKAGRPAPEMVSVVREVFGSAWYGDAVQWAHEKLYLNLYDSGKSLPGDNCTRSDAIFLLAGSENHPAPEEIKPLFLNEFQYLVSYPPHILWAEEQGIIKGDETGRINADEACTRGQFVVFLYRCHQAKGDAKAFYGAQGEALFSLDSDLVYEIRFKKRSNGQEKVLLPKDKMFEHSIQLLNGIRVEGWVPFAINDIIVFDDSEDWTTFPKDGMWYELTICMSDGSERSCLMDYDRICVGDILFSDATDSVGELGELLK